MTHIGRVASGRELVPVARDPFTPGAGDVPATAVGGLVAVRGPAPGSQAGERAHEPKQRDRGGDEEESRPWLTRELHIVQPKLVVVMGEPALEFLNAIEFPLAGPLEPTIGDLQRFTPTIAALFVPDIDESLDEAPAKTRFWNAFKALGPWWAELPPY